VDDFIGFIIFAVVFVLGPLLEHIRKSKQPPPPPQQRKPQRVVFEPQSTRPQPVPGAEDERAAAMVPDELWAVLTGGAPKPRAQPQPLPPDAELEDVEEDEEAFAEAVSAEATGEEAVSLETLPRRIVPVVASMETQPDPRARHVAFHKRLGEQVEVKVIPAKKWLDSRADLRRAFILQTILERPKGLE
jgi:hypothetical protein